MADKSKIANELPWSERVTMLSFNPDAGNRDDMAKLASELLAVWQEIGQRRDYESFLQGRDRDLHMDSYVSWLKNTGRTSECIE